MNRRGFLSFLPAAVFGGRKAIAEAAKDEAEKWALVEPTGVTEPRYKPMTFGSFAFDTPEIRRSEALRDLANLFAPSNIDAIRRAVTITRLDPDIASLRSFSLSVKMEMQRERGVQKELYWEKTRLERIISEALEAVGGER